VTIDLTPSPVRDGNTESGNLASDWLPRNLALFKVSDFFTFFSSWNLASKCTQHRFLFSLRKLGIQVSASLFFQNVTLFYNDESTVSDYWSYQDHRNFSNRANYAQFFRLQRTAELVLKRGTQNSSPFRARSHKCPLTTFYAAKKKRNALNVLLIYIYIVMKIVCIQTSQTSPSISKHFISKNCKHSNFF